MIEKTTHLNQKRSIVSVCLLCLTFLFGPGLPLAMATVSGLSPLPDGKGGTVDYSVSGVVRDNAGVALPGVSVLIKGTAIGTVSANDGKYTITVPNDEAILVFSFIGFVRQEVPVNGRTTIDVALQEEVTSLDEVVIIGYGTQKKSDLTGSVGSVNNDQLQERPPTSLNQALAGRIAGVQVNTNSGRPGGRTNVRVRGFSSINTTNNPLYIVDGVALPLITMQTDNQPIFNNAIDYINPNDIESVEVLKDASATAIYGARGANGVILITTKRGKAGAPGRVTYDVNFSTNVIGPNGKPPVLNSEQFLAVEDLAYQNMQKYDPVKWAAGAFANRDPALSRTNPLLFDSNGKPLYETNWLEESTDKNNLSQNHQLTFAGGGENKAYSIGLGYRDDQGLLMNSGLKRYSARFTYDDQIKKWLKVGGTLSYNRQSENVIDNNPNVMRYIVEGIPFLPVKYPDGRWSRMGDYANMENVLNPVHILTEQKLVVKSQTITGNIYSNINVTKDLELRTVLGTNILTQGINQFQSNGLTNGTGGSASVFNSEDTFWSLENYFTYNKQISSDHTVNILLGHSMQESKNFNSVVRINNFPSDHFEYNNLGAASTSPAWGSGASGFAFNSYFGRANYTLKDKYLLTVTGRVDGSSRFGDNNKYAFFPSAALAWKIKQEGFMSDMSAISNLKLRASYGITGNSEAPPYSSTATVASGYVAIYNNARVGGTGLGRLANPNMKWEKTAQSDIGLELGLFQNRIVLEADVYYRKTTDMLLDAPTPRSSGYSSLRMNVGSMENKGLELALNTVNVQTENLTWSSSFNISMNRNKVLSLATPADILNVGGPALTNPSNVIRVGEPVGSFWGLVRLGTWGTAEADEAALWTSYRGGLPMLPGDIKYQDFNGDRAITDADRVIIGNGNPDGWGAFTNTVRYKNLDFTVELQYMYGNEVLDFNTHPAEDRVSIANSYTTVLNAWTPTNQNTMIAEIRETRAGYVTNVDSHWVKDGSFVRGRNILLGYTFPAHVLDRLSLSRLRLYGSVQNFFLLVDKELIGDPEVTPNRGAEGSNIFSQGTKWYDYPKSTTFMLGLQVGF